MSVQRVSPGLGRRVLCGALVTAPVILASRPWPAAALDGRFAALEARCGGRLGVSVFDTATLTRTGHRAHERFALCSTFKLLAVAHILARIDNREERLDRRIIYTAGEVVPSSPITAPCAGAQGLTVAEICEAAIVVSDNTAGNLLIEICGGPARLTRFIRTLGDSVTRLDRKLPELIAVAPDDPRDTTSPAAMGQNIQRLLLGDVLRPASRARLTDWLVACRTGEARIRAGLPHGWRVGDKTGAGLAGETNDVGIIWPPGRPPVILSIYYVKPGASSEARSAVIAEAAGLVAANV